MDLIYAQEKNHAPTIQAFGIWMLCDVDDGNYTIEQTLTRYMYN